MLLCCYANFTEPMIRGVSVCNGNALITPLINELELYTIYRKKVKTWPFEKCIQLSIIFITYLVTNFLKGHTHIHSLYFPSDGKETFSQNQEGMLYFL